MGDKRITFERPSREDMPPEEDCPVCGKPMDVHLVAYVRDGVCGFDFAGRRCPEHG